jgi:hypothetical protein
MSENGVGNGIYAHYLIVVEKVLPHRVAVLEFMPDYLSRARTWIFTQLAGIELCTQQAYWPRSKPGIITAHAPAWMADDTESEAA